MKIRKKKIVAGFEILVLVCASFAVAFLFAKNVGTVEAQVLGGTPSPAGVPGSAMKPDTLVYDNAGKAIAKVGADGNPVFLEEAGGTLETTPATTTGGGTGIGGLFTGNAFGTGGAAGAISALTSGLIWGAIVGGGAYLLANLFGLNKDQAASIGLAAGGGTFAGTTTYFLAQQGTLGATLAQNAGLFGLGIGAGVGIGILLATYKKTKKELVKFECLPYEPPLGGADCEKCNLESQKPCSEYRCKSLGQACELVNKGTEKEMCVWIHKEDVKAPTITPWDDALRPKGLKYLPDNTISPPNRGVKIVQPKGQGCLEAFTDLEFGVITNEPAQCRIDYEPKANFDEMQFPFGETQLFLYNHTQRLKVPSPFTEEEGDVPEIHTKGTYTLYTRCIDANGNGKDSAFVAFRFCVNPGPDTTQPSVVGTSIMSGRAVQFDADKVPIEVYANEPAECKWSREDKAYEAMEYTMNCATKSYQVNSELNYVCSSELTGIKNSQNNNFYFRCKDQPSKPENERNVMTTSYPLMLRGTEKLTIKSVAPNGTIEGGTGVVTVNLLVETAHGADEGKSICYIDGNAAGDFRTPMDTEPSVMHNQSLDLTEGNHQYFFRCIDSGGNRAETNTSFVIKIDKQQPLIARVFRDGEKLKLITNEPAKCVYSLTSCDYNFDEATETVLLYEDAIKKVVHYTSWDETKTFYIKCSDLRGRKPDPNKCSIIVKGSGEL